MRRSFKRFQRKILNDVKSQIISLRIHSIHFFASSKTMHRSPNFVQVLQRRITIIIQFKLFIQARRFFDEIKDEGIKILETKIKKEENNCYELVNDIIIMHQINMLEYAKKFTTLKAMNFQNIILKIHEIRLDEFFKS